MKLALKLFISVGIGALCIWFLLRRMDVGETMRVLRQTSPTAVLLYMATMIPVHLFRSWRWEYLLRPIGVSLPLPRLIAISSVGFMGILALPVRLGEFIRPYYVVRGGQSRMSAVLGTVAVERIVDGLVISIVFFVCFMGSASQDSNLRFAAWASLLGFVGLTLFLAFALRSPDATIKFALRVTLLSRLAPRLAERASDKLRALIQGFRVLHEPRNLIPFLVQTVLYWGSNGFGMWVLARYMHLDISLTAAYATMALTGVVLSLPNSPGLVGQFQLGIVAALGAYLPAVTVNSYGFAYSIALHFIQVVWYLSLGVLGLVFVGGGTSSLRQVVMESNAAAEGSSK